MKLVLSTALVCLTLMFSNSFAQTAGVINSQEVLEAMPEYNKGMEDLQKYSLSLQKKLESLELDATKKYMALDSAKKTGEVSNFDLQWMETEAQLAQQKLQSFQQSAQGDLQNAQAEMFAPIQVIIDSVVSIVCKDKGVDYVMDAQNLIYKSDKLTNITDAVIAIIRAPYVNGGTDPKE
jgi:outer membrane protein